MALKARRYLGPGAWSAFAALLFLLPNLGGPAFYESFLYLIFSWVALATSWSLLSGYAGYFSLGHAAFFGAGVYTTATLTTKFDVPFLWTVPIAALVAALLATAVGAVVFRLRSLRGELFALLTLAVTFILATIILNTGIDGGGGVFLSGVALPALAPTASGTIYRLGLGLAVLAVALSYVVRHSRFGMGLFAIHDDEDVAEVKGVPTFRYKLMALALSAAIAGAAGGVQAIYVGYVTVGETFAINVPLYVILMSVLGGARHWFGPAVGATLITVALFAFTSGGEALLGRAIVALALIVVVLLLPDGIVPTLLRLADRWRSPERRRPAAELPPTAVAGEPPHCAAAEKGPAILVCDDVRKSFGGIQALRGVTLSVHKGEILGLVGPNGSGKTTFINMISGHFSIDRGSIALGSDPIAGLPAHRIACLGIARTYQIPRPFNHLSVLDNVALAASFGTLLSGRSAILDEAWHWLEFTGLARHAFDLPSKLNLHERKFLELARALAARPQLLLLDEILSGLNPAEVENAITLIRAIRDRGASIIFIEHLMRAVVELSDRVAVLNEGAVIAIGTPREVMQNPEVVSVYLGKAYAS